MSITSTTNSRNVTLDAVKGIGIILIVVGHCFFSFTSYIYLFHMALFFMVSGYLWNDRKAADITSAKQYVLSKLKHLYLPFVACNSSFTLLNNFFIRLGILSNNPAFPEMYPSNVLSPYFDFPSLCFELLKHMCFIGDTQLGNATWFLRSLFFVSVVHLILRYIVLHYRHGDKLNYAVIGLAMFGTVFFARTDYGLIGGLQSCFPGYVAFLFGILFKRLSHLALFRHPPLIMSVSSFFVLLVLDSCGSVSVGTGKVTGLLFYSAAAFAGWILVYPVVDRLPTALKRSIAYVGKRSLWIVMLHYLAFKPVTFAYLYFTGSNMLGLAKFPVLGHLTWLKVVYAIVGTILPLVAEYLFSLVKKRISRPTN